MISTQKKDITNRTLVCNLDLDLRKCYHCQKRDKYNRKYITIEILKQVIRAELNGEDALILLLTTLRKSWIYQMLVYRQSVWSTDKFRDKNSFTEGFFFKQVEVQ